MNKNDYHGAGFLDLSKAFDTVSHDILIKKLEHYGVRGGALLLIKPYLSNKNQFVSFCGSRSEMCNVNIGVPQGSVLGPLLFRVYITDLPLAIRNLKAILFADDTTMHYAHSDKRTLSDTISSDMTLVRDWLLANYLTLNSQKSYYMIFSLRNVPSDLRITIGQHVLERHPCGKFLGVTLDEKLTFTSHVKHIVNKISKVVGMFHKVKLFFPKEVLRQLYFSLIHPHLIYCIHAWGASCQATINPLVILQKKVIRIISGSEYLAHTEPLFKSPSILKIDKIHTFHSLLFMHKALVLDKYPIMKNEIFHQPRHHYPTRNNNYTTPTIRINKCKQNIVFQGITNWNSLPTNLRNTTHFSTFKRALKKYLLTG